MTDVDTPEPATHISLCTGYGGIDLGLRRVLPACRTILACEIESFAVANLVAKMEAGQMDACPIWTDLKTLPLEWIPKGVSILSGGFPCQPFSCAGRHGADDDPRHLFPYIKNAIRVIQPRWVFLENVEGIISAKLKGEGWADPAGTPVLLHVLRELEREGYDCAWGIFSASLTGAPHQRKRIFILGRLAQPASQRIQGRGAGRKQIARPHAQETLPLCRREAGGDRWPARPGEHQHEWEEPRVVGNTKGGQAHSRESGDLGEAEQGGEGEPATVASPSAELADTGSNRDGCSRAKAEPNKDEPQDGVFEPHGKHENRQAEPLMGGAVNGPASGVDPHSHRVDRLRLLGNGVVPSTCEIAFRTLYEEITDGTNP